MWCVFNRGPDLFQDLRVYFSDSGCFLIFVDDANRVSRFEYIVQLLKDQRKDQQIKVIATVRTYARETVREAALPYGGGIEVELRPMKEEQIRELVEDAYRIHNSLYLERIAEIAGGNPRLAIMAAEPATREDSLHSISDVSTLYDEYFASIRRDLADLDDENLLKAAGIVAFFRVVDRSNDEMMNSIWEAFGIPPDQLWNGARRLHDLEMVDMYEEEVARTSDQVLATYLFCLAFFKEQVLDFSAVLHNFFPSLRHRVVDAVYSALSAFHAGAITEGLRPHVDNAWESSAKANDGNSLLQLMEVFWFVKETEILLLLRDVIAKMEPAGEDLPEPEFKAKSDMTSPCLLTVLSSFRHASTDSFRMALALLFEYLAKRPGDLGNVLYLLKDRFGFEHTSYARGFGVQRAVIDVLWEQTHDGKTEFFSKVFLAVAGPYLHTRFHSSEAKRDGSVAVISFELSPTPELSELRRTIWQRLFRLHEVPAVKQEMLNVFESYCMDGYAVSAAGILAQDAESVAVFIYSELAPDSYRHCSMVNRYLDSLDRHEVEYEEGLRHRFTNETFALSELLLDDWVKRREPSLEFNEFERLKWKRIEEHFEYYGITDYEHFFQLCLGVHAELKVDRERYQLQEAVERVLLILTGRDPSLYADVLEHYLRLGEPLWLPPARLVAALISLVGSKSAHVLIGQDQYPTKRLWLFGYFHTLPSDDVGTEQVDELLALYREAELREMLPGFDYLLKYVSQDEQIVARVAEIVLQRAEEDASLVSTLSPLFYSRTDVNEALVALFEVDFVLLKRAYFAVSSPDRHGDYYAVTYNRILDHDPDFVVEYIDWVHARVDSLARYDDSRDYSILWRREDYEQLMTRVVERIYEHEQGWGLRAGTYLGTFFRLESKRPPELEVQEGQDHFLRQLIETRHEESGLMVFVFSIIAEFLPERRHPLTALFLKHNSSFEDFQKVPLQPSVFDFSVPMLQARMEYLESLLPLLNTVDLLRHKQHVERRLQKMRQHIEQEKKRNFMEDGMSITEMQAT